MNTIEQLVQICRDPLLDSDVQNLGFILSQHNSTIVLNAGFPVKPFEQSLKPVIEERLKQTLPTQTLHVSFNSAIRAHRTQMAGKGLRGVKNVIAVASGKGGVGKSTVTVNIATALAKAGARVGILDADIYGPSIPMMLGKHDPVQLKDDRYLPVDVHGIQAMSIGYLTHDEQALIWRGPMLAKALIQMLDITLWDDLDYLFIDLPPGTGDIQLSLVQKIPLTGAIVVTTPQNVATLDAQKAIKMFEHTHIDVLGIIENMSLHRCSACGNEETIFGEGGAKRLSEQCNIPLLGQLPLDSQIRENSDEGLPTALSDQNQLASHWMKAALNLSITLAKKPLNYADKFPDIVIE